MRTLITGGTIVTAVDQYLGDVLMKTARKEQATELLQNAIQLRPDLRVAHVDLGILYADGKRYDAAVSEFRQAIKIDPASFDAHYRLARLFRQLARTCGHHRVPQRHPPGRVFHHRREVRRAGLRPAGKPLTTSIDVSTGRWSGP